jgi:hypothetical protein
MTPSLSGAMGVVEVRLAEPISRTVWNAHRGYTRALAEDRGAVAHNGVAACRHLLMGEQGA